MDEIRPGAAETPVVVQPPAATTGLPAPTLPATRPRDRGPFLWLLVGVAIILWLARDVLGPFIVAAVLAYAFGPVVSSVERRLGWPRIAIVVVAYVIVVTVLVLLVIALAGRISQEVSLLAASGPNSLATLLREVVGQDTITIGGQQIAVADIARELQARLAGVISSPGDAAHLAGEVGSILLSSILALIVTFYFLVDGRMLRDRTIALLPDSHRDRTVDMLGRIHAVLGKWLRGQLFLIGLVTVVVYIALGPILHLPYALGIAILTGFLEIIPLIGPLVATAIAAIDAFAHGGAGLAVVVIVIYFVLRQVEDQVVMPVVIGRAVHLHPVVTIFAVLVGLSVYGVLGGLLGVPIAAAVNVVFRELYGSPEPAGVVASVDAVPDSG